MVKHWSEVEAGLYGQVSLLNNKRWQVTNEAVKKHQVVKKRKVHTFGKLARGVWVGLASSSSSI